MEEKILTKFCIMVENEKYHPIKTTVNNKIGIITFFFSGSVLVEI